jgi:hypothetical protein
MAKKKPAKKKASAKKAKVSAKSRAVKKSAAPKATKKIAAKPAPKAVSKAKKTIVAKAKPVAKKSAGRASRRGKTYDFEQPRVAAARNDTSERAGQSGDLQGLSDVEEADSESVDELLEEGQSFEAEAVSGVENAPDADRGPVRTHEVPEDDVPEEYLDKDDQ